MLRKSFFIACLLIFALFTICLVSCDDDNDDSEATATITYEVGKPGPTGGYVFYDCDADNEDGNADGLKSSECGWRYLEAAPADLKIVEGTPTVDSSLADYSKETNKIYYGFYRTSADGDYLYVNGTTTYNSSSCTGTAIGTGKDNTKMLVNTMGDEAFKYRKDSSNKSQKISDYAARLCDILEYTKDGKTYDDWFLPSKDELNLMYTNLHEQKLGAFEGGYYWSSSENSNSSARDALVKNFNDGDQTDYGREGNNRVRPVRAFLNDEVCEHTWDEGQVTVEATFNHNGIKTYTCTECHMTKVEIIPILTPEVGKAGPTGGIIFYDCDADNDTGNADGLKSSDCGWRYLEAAPADLRIVAGTPTVDSTLSGYSSGTYDIYYGYYRTSAIGSDLYVNESETYGEGCTGTAIGTGENNTELLVGAMGESAYKYDSTDSDNNSEKISDYAARLCYILEYTKDEMTYTDWFLPSWNELEQMYTNLKAKSLGDFAGAWYWSSSEDSISADYALLQFFSIEMQASYDRSYAFRVRPVRAF